MLLVRERISHYRGILSVQMQLKKDARNTGEIDRAKECIRILSEWLQSKGSEADRAKVEEGLAVERELKELRLQRRKEFKEYLSQLGGNPDVGFRLDTIQEVDFIFDLIKREVFEKDPPRTNLNFIWPKGVISYYSARVHREVSREKIGKSPGPTDGRQT